MQFEKLRLSGFKSFVDPTELVIHKGLTGIVGPNGCGKSNLLEALRWAMGENRAKSMRGKGMEDVIFAGTDTRSPRNMAEVTLVLGNEDRTAPAAFNDSDLLEVTRRIERDAGSAYRINSKDVRAKDVQLLFADAATGAHSPALVRQGRISELINAKPQARRVILEEAAGISGLHSRRHEAELRLRAAESNLLRMDDVMQQIDQQLGSLKRQARQANRYRNLSGHIRSAEAIMLHLRWSEAKVAVEKAEEAFQKAESLVAEATERTGATSVAQVTAQEAIPPLREREAEMAAALQRLKIAREGLEEEERRAREQAQTLESRLIQIGHDIERENALAQDAQAAVERLLGEAEELEVAREGESDAAEIKAERAEEAAAILEESEAELDELNQRVAAARARRQSLERQAEETRRRVETLRVQANNNQLEMARIEDEMRNDIVVIAATEAVEEAQAKAEAAREAFEAAEAARETAQGSEAVARDVAQDARTELEKLRAEERALADLLSDEDQDMWPPVVDAISVDPGFETALGAALGEDLNNSADEAAPIHWGHLNNSDPLPSLPVGARPLSEVVRAPSALNRRLSQIGIVGKDQGGALRHQLKGGQRLVSVEGDLWRWDGFTAKAEAPTPAAKRLEQRNKLKELTERRGELEAQAEEQQARFEEVRERSLNAVQAESDHRTAWRSAEDGLGQALRAESEAQKKSAERTSRLAVLSSAKERITADLEEAEAKAEEASEGLLDLEPETGMDEKLESLRLKVQTRRAELGEARAALEGMRREAEARQNRLLAITDEKHAWEARARNAASQIETLNIRTEETRETLEDLRAVPAEIAEKRVTLIDEIQAAEARRTEAAETLAAAEQKLAEADKMSRDAVETLTNIREERARFQAAVEGGRERLADAVALVRERMSCEPHEVLSRAELNDGEELPPLSQIEAKLERLKRERDNMGAVNLRAEEEAAELLEQLDTMTSEKEDLEGAIARLRQGIASLNKEGRERLLSAFEIVNSNFTRLFTHLFGGGTAHLEMTESDDPLEAGIEIMAMPPGKKLQSLGLLSGGEQTLTALSLIFAVFLTNPSPICVLDEVDAPLDDANVGRFCDLLHEMIRTTDTRFLCITHHALTMARMDRLFGVTMGERGVSQLVSVDLSTAENLVNAA